MFYVEVFEKEDYADYHEAIKDDDFYGYSTNTILG